MFGWSKSQMAASGAENAQSDDLAKCKQDLESGTSLMASISDGFDLCLC